MKEGGSEMKYDRIGWEKGKNKSKYKARGGMENSMVASEK